MSIEVTRALLNELLEQALSAHPLECCGILFGTPGRIERALPAHNVHPSPRTHFEIDPQALIDAHRAAREGGPHVVGYFHSHPAGPPEPSATDRACAARDGRIWAIVGLEGGERTVLFWRDGRQGFEPLSPRVVAR